MKYDGGLKENFPGVQNIEAVTEKGQARDIAAKKTNSGKSGKTLDESLKVVKYAEAIKDDYPKKAEALKNIYKKFSKKILTIMLTPIHAWMNG